MRLLFVIPTNGGPLAVTALRPRPGLPVSAAFADGDFRGLPWSGDYGRLCAPGGPLSRVIPQLAPHELRLSASFDSGRSWEAPVALAHLLLAQGHTCAAKPAEAEAIIWTTGAVDLDLALIGGDYALGDKIEKTAPLLAAVPETTPLYVILPPAHDTEAAWTRLQAIANARPVIRIATAPMIEVAAALRERMAPTPAAAAPAVRQKSSPQAQWPALAAVAAALAVAGGLGIHALNPAIFEPQNRPELAPQYESGAGSSKQAEIAPQAHEASTPAPSPRVVISEIRAAPGSDCNRVLFGSSTAVRHAVPPLDDTAFTSSRLDDMLCGIEIKPAAATDRLTVEGDLAAVSHAPTVRPDGTATYIFLASRPQKIVYQIQVSGDTESGPRTVVVRHSILR